VDVVQYPAAEETRDRYRDIKKNLRVHASLKNNIDRTGVKLLRSVDEKANPV
jgi:hypothetical protein